MKLLKQALAVSGAMSILAITLALIAPQRVQAVAAAFVQIVPGGSTHVGQYESQLVSLYCPMGYSSCFAVDSNGSVNSTVPYVVPTGYTLLITDYEWTQFRLTAPNSVVYDNLTAEQGAAVHTFVASGTSTNNSGDAWVHDKFTTGIRVGSGVQLTDSLALGNAGWAYVQGYLVPND